MPVTEVKTTRSISSGRSPDCSRAPLTASSPRRSATSMKASLAWPKPVSAA